VDPASGELPQPDETDQESATPFVLTLPPGTSPKNFSLTVPLWCGNITSSADVRPASPCDCGGAMPPGTTRHPPRK
jgi:hypothetical protein